MSFYCIFTVKKKKNLLILFYSTDVKLLWNHLFKLITAFAVSRFRFYFD